MTVMDFLNLCKHGTAKEIRNALIKGADPNANDKVGMTTVMVAAMPNVQWEPQSSLFYCSAGGLQRGGRPLSSEKRHKKAKYAPKLF